MSIMASKKQLVSRRSGQRKCSVCRKPGHTKRTCATQPTKASSSVLREKKKTSSHVRVRVDGRAAASPHRVELQKETSSHWDHVDVYSEKPKTRVKRVAVDLSRMVEAHNERQQKKDISLFRDAMKKYVSKSLSAEAKSALAQKVHKKRTQIKRPKHVDIPNVQTQKVQSVPRRSLSELFADVVAQCRYLFSGRRLAYSMLTLVIIVGLPLPALGYYQKLKQTNAYLVQESTNAFMSLQASTVAALHANIDQAGQDLGSALASFAQARDVLEKDYHLLLSVAKLLPIIGDHVKSRQRLLVSGQHLALGNTYLIKGLEQIKADEDLAFTTKLGVLRTHMRSAIPQYQQALNELHHVDTTAIPVEHQQSFRDFQLLFGTFVDDMKDLTDLIDAMQLVLGDEGFRRYLIVFQNHHEIRPTGGFVGSYALLDVQKGKILNIDVPSGGSYDLQGQLSEYVQPPVPLQLVNGRWEFQDSNWFPDFAKSGEKMAWFYEHAREESVDGVIAVNASVLERFLRVIGPVVDEKHDLLIADYDALEKIQEVVEEGEEKDEGAPKAILSRILDQMMHRLDELKEVDLVLLLAELHGAAQEKEIQVFMRDEQAQRTFRDFGWTGELYQSAEQQDYLMVVNTNVQGQKSDARVKQEIEHAAVVQEDGSVVDAVTIRRTHTGDPSDAVYGANNISYMRVYVPEGAELIEATGFTYPPEEAFHVPEDWYKEDLDVAKTEGNERFHIASGTRVTDEFGKTAFGNWVMTSPGQTSEVTFMYKLPFSVVEQKAYDTNTEKWKEMFTREYFTQRSQYQLVVQKQSGVTSDFESIVVYDDEWVPVWRSHDEMDLTIAGARLDMTLDRDQFVSVLMERSVK